MSRRCFASTRPGARRRRPCAPCRAAPALPSPPSPPALDDLMAAGKLVRLPDGRLDSPTTHAELAWQQERRSEQVRAGRASAARRARPAAKAAPPRAGRAGLRMKKANPFSKTRQRALNPRRTRKSPENRYRKSLPPFGRESARARARRARPLPDDWLPSQEDRRCGADLGFTAFAIDDMAEDLRLWARGSGGAQARLGGDLRGLDAPGEPGAAGPRGACAAGSACGRPAPSHRPRRVRGAGPGSRRRSQTESLVLSPDRIPVEAPGRARALPFSPLATRSASKPRPAGIAAGPPQRGHCALVRAFRNGRPQAALRVNHRLNRLGPSCSSTSGTASPFRRRAAAK